MSKRSNAAIGTRVAVRVRFRPMVISQLEHRVVPRPCNRSSADSAPAVRNWTVVRSAAPAAVPSPLADLLGGMRCRALTLRTARAGERQPAQVAERLAEPVGTRQSAACQYVGARHTDAQEQAEVAKDQVHDALGDCDQLLLRRCLAESIVYLILRNLSLLLGIRVPCAYILASGGLSRSDRFCQALSNLSGLPLRRPVQCEASARGTAFLLAGRPADWAQLPEQRFSNHSPIPHCWRAISAGTIAWPRHYAMFKLTNDHRPETDADGDPCPNGCV